MWEFCSSSKNILANNFFSSHHLSALKCIKNVVRNSYLSNPRSQKVLKANLHVVSKKKLVSVLAVTNRLNSTV